MVHDFTDYLALHCHREEAFMAKIKYPGRSQHIEEHNDLFVTISSLSDSDENIMESNFIPLVCKYVYDHVSVTDRALAEFCQQKNIDLGLEPSATLSWPI